MLRMIREVEPPKPSTRLSESKDSLPSISAQRKTEPAKLTKLVRGELDWIVMKALEKDRSRRYETANGFARDIENYLAGEPVEACPPSAAYKLRKFTRKNKTALVTAGAFVLLLAAAAVVSAWQAFRATRAETKAWNAQTLAEERYDLATNAMEAEKQAAAAERQARKDADARAAETKAVLDFVENRIFAAARPGGLDGGLGPGVTLRKAVDIAVPFVAVSFKDQPLVEARLRLTLGTSYAYMADHEKAAAQYEAARALYTRHLAPDDNQTLGVTNNLAISYANLGRQEDALKLFEEILTRRKAKLGVYHRDTLGSVINLANCYNVLGRHDEALRLHEETLSLLRATLGPDHVDTLNCMHNLAASYAKLGRNQDSLKLLEQTLALRKSKLGPDHPDTLSTMHNLAVCYAALGRRSEALKLHEQTLELLRAKLGDDHPYTTRSMMELADKYSAVGRYGDALKLHEEALTLRKGKLPPDHEDVLTSMHNLAGSYFALGRHAEALKLREETHALRKTKLGPDHPDTLLGMWGLTETLIALKRYADAVKVINECLPRASGKAVHPQMVPNMIVMRLQCFARLNDAAGCRQTAEMWEQLKATDGLSLFNAAFMRAVTAGVIQSVPGDDVAGLAKDQADRAMAWLSQAIAAGYKDVARMRDLLALRDREDFKKLIAELEAQQRTGSSSKP
jgi:tetratricopeptide (TPR) repeat protein